MTKTEIMLLVHFGVIQQTIKPKLEKMKRNPPRKNVLHFNKWNLVAPKKN